MNYANVPLIRVKKFASTMATISKVLMILGIVVVSLAILVMVIFMAIPSDFFAITVGSEVTVSLPFEKYFGEEFSYDSMKDGLTVEEGMEIKETEDGFDIVGSAEQSMSLASYMLQLLVPSIVVSLCWIFIYYFLSAFFGSICRNAGRTNMAMMNDESNVFTVAGKKALKGVFVTVIILISLEFLLYTFGLGQSSFSLTSIIVACVVYFGMLVFDYIASLVQRNALQQQALGQLHYELDNARAQAQQMQLQQEQPQQEQPSDSESQETSSFENTDGE